MAHFASGRFRWRRARKGAPRLSESSCGSAAAKIDEHNSRVYAGNAIPGLSDEFPRTEPVTGICIGQASTALQASPAVLPVPGRAMMGEGNGKLGVGQRLEESEGAGG